ncbi:MAG: hypothetical protein AAF335_01740 [Bacteroidota bacterium]
MNRNIATLRQRATAFLCLILPLACHQTQAVLAWGSTLRTLGTATLLAFSIHQEPVVEGASGYWLTTINDFVARDLTTMGDHVAIGGETFDEEPTIVILDNRGRVTKNITFETPHDEGVFRKGILRSLVYDPGMHVFGVTGHIAGDSMFFIGQLDADGEFRKNSWVNYLTEEACTDPLCSSIPVQEMYSIAPVITNNGSLGYVITGRVEELRGDTLVSIAATYRFGNTGNKNWGRLIVGSPLGISPKEFYSILYDVSFIPSGRFFYTGTIGNSINKTLLCATDDKMDGGCIVFSTSFESSTGYRIDMGRNHNHSIIAGTGQKQGHDESFYILEMDLQHRNFTNSFQWGYYIDGKSGARGLEKDSNGNAIAVGYYYLEDDWRVAFVYQFSVVGEKNWEYVYGDDTPQWVEVTSVVIDDNDDITIAGWQSRRPTSSKKSFVIHLPSSGTNCGSATIPLEEEQGITVIDGYSIVARDVSLFSTALSTPTRSHADINVQSSLPVCSGASRLLPISFLSAVLTMKILI